ncbi:MAG TPA: glycosyltransferase [Thermoleophilia bacterium]|nr:glycosyltransferase [Thermoleophilia bacterium]
MKVSVLLLTYNHSRFLRHALDSALSQRTTFDVEIVIGEDCSSDGTRDMVIEFARSYPDRVRAVLSPTNLGECGNIAQTLAACRGDYVALLDGDDYWTADHKLQRQVDYLDAHPGCSLSFHNALAFHDDGAQESYPFNGPEQRAAPSLEDLWGGNFIATCAAMFRRSACPSLPSWYRMLPWGDWPLFILAARTGSLAFIDEPLGAYRIHAAGAWSRLSEVEQILQVIGFYEAMNVNLALEYDGIIQTMIAKHYQALALAYERAGDQSRARACRELWAARTTPIEGREGGRTT